MLITVFGSRSSDEDWLYSRKVPDSDLPELTEGQKKLVDGWKISPLDYARNLYAERLTGKRLVAKTKRFSDWLEAQVERRVSGGSLSKVCLDTFAGKYLAEVILDRGSIPLSVDEETVDGYIATGNPEAGRVLENLLYSIASEREEMKAS